MPKSCKDWKPPGSTVQMRPGLFSDGSHQDLYLPDGRFKGMAQILYERGFVDAPRLPAQCKGFKCVDVSSTAQCCCRRILFNQPDFQNQKPEIVEFVEAWGHKVIFYPKFYCELNFIEQIWGAAKFQYHLLPIPTNIKAMEQNICDCLDSIPLQSIQRYVISLRI